MPDLKISQLPAATTPLAGTEIVPLVQGGTTDRATVADFLKSAVAGTAAAPAFAFSADPNTGIFSPTADNIALTTGGTERLRVTSAGNVGVGNTTPLATIHAGTATTDVSVPSGTFAAIRGGNYAVAGTGGIQLSGGYGDSGRIGAFNIKAVGSGAGAGVFVNDLLFTTTASFSGTETERMRLDASGNLGIGTSSPVSPVTVHNATANTTAVEIRGGGGSTQSILAFTYGNAASATATNGRIFTSTSEFSIRAEASQPLTFVAGGSERMRLDASGNLGLGVTPSAWGTVLRSLDIFGGVSLFGGSTQIGLSQNAYFDSANFIYRQTAAAAFFRAIGNTFQWNIAPSGTAGTAITFTQAMTLDASGNLQLGTTTANSSRLRVFGTSDAETRVQFFRSANSAGSIWQAGQALRFGVDGIDGSTLQATLTTAGNLGLGTDFFGTSAAKVLSIGSGTEPSTGPADTVQFFSVDRSAGNTIPGIRCEGTGVTDAAITNVTVTNKIAIKVNGTVYYLLATTSAA